MPQGDPVGYDDCIHLGTGVHRYSMNFLTWNVRGLGNPIKIPKIRKLIVSKSIDFIGLTETKLAHYDHFFVSRIWDSPTTAYEYCPGTSSHSGGILAIWSTESFCVANIIKGSRWIVLEGSVRPLD